MSSSREELMEEVVPESLDGFFKTVPAVDFAFAYGSAAFPQQGRTAKHAAESAMVDYIFGVRRPEEWHDQNLQQNRHHYRSSIIAMGGGSRVAWVAENMGAGVHFNPYVEHKGARKVKYGVVSLRALARDLSSWDRLYISGRMQKPIKVLKDNHGIMRANEQNLRSALAAALLMLPGRFSEEDLFLELCRLSYEGDIRTLMAAEDVNKVQAIVRGNMGQFRRYYSRPLEDMLSGGALSEGAPQLGEKLYIQDTSNRATADLVSRLPLRMLMQAKDTIGLSTGKLPLAKQGDHLKGPRCKGTG